MKKLLFISNISKKITNFSIPSIEAAQKLGYDVHLAANYTDFKNNQSNYNVTIHHIDIDRNPFSLKNYKAYKQMISLLRKEKFDVIHCNTPVGGFLGRICGKKSKVRKIIYTAHGFHFYNGGPRMKNLLFRGIEKWLAKYTDVIITINNEDYLAAKQFSLRKNGKVFFIPGVGVDTTEYQLEDLNKDKLKKSLGFNKNDFLLIAMGDLIKRKNYSSSIRAIAQTNNKGIHFLICGSGPELENLKKLAKELDVENQIHFLGFRSDIKELLSIADIFLFTTYQEGLPRSMMEAMASGLPCIASKVRGNIDLLKEEKGGYLLLPNDYIGMAKSINKLTDNRNLRESMGMHNLKIIKDFDVENIKRKMKEIYNKELEI